MNLNVSVALNNLSFGFVSYNILRELYNRGISPNLFLIGDQADLSSFDKTEQDFALWIQSCVGKARRNYKRDYPTFRLWHVGQSEFSQSNEQHLFTFHEEESMDMLQNPL